METKKFAKCTGLFTFTIKIKKLGYLKKIAVITPKCEKCGFTIEETAQKDAVRMLNSVDLDQTEGAVCSGSTLFAQNCLSENLQSFWNFLIVKKSHKKTCLQGFWPGKT